MQQTNESRVDIEEAATVKVWDLFIRTFHWTMAFGFATAFILGEVHAAALHVLVGYVLCVLLVTRVYWGFKGSKFARFNSFFFSINETREYTRAMFKGHPKHYLGHNPAGALMVFALIAFLTVLFVSGLLSLGTIDFEGPFVFLANSVSDETSYMFRYVHEFLPNLGLGLVALHILGVAVGSIQHKENLVRAMLTGNKQVESDSQNQNNKQ
jgi:cytochrome b